MKAGDFIIKQLQIKLGLNFDDLVLYSMKRVISLYGENKEQEANKILHDTFTYTVASMIEFYITGFKDCITFQNEV
jgi:hypothetical protein